MHWCGARGVVGLVWLGSYFYYLFLALRMKVGAREMGARGAKNKMRGRGSGSPVPLVRFCRGAVALGGGGGRGNFIRAMHGGGEVG